MLVNSLKILGQSIDYVPNEMVVEEIHGGVQHGLHHGLVHFPTCV